MRFSTLAIACCLLFVGCVRPPAPGPDDDWGPSPYTPPAPTEVSRAAYNGSLQFASGMGSACESAANELRAGNIKTADELHKFLAARNSEVSENAFQGLHSLFNDTFGETRWDAARAEKSMRDAAAGFRRVK
jgi:hypothetical protein